MAHETHDTWFEETSFKVNTVKKCLVKRQVMRWNARWNYTDWRGKERWRSSKINKEHVSWWLKIWYDDWSAVSLVIGYFSLFSLVEWIPFYRVNRLVTSNSEGRCFIHKPTRANGCCEEGTPRTDEAKQRTLIFPFQKYFALNTTDVFDSSAEDPQRHLATLISQFVFVFCNNLFATISTVK